MKAGLSLIGSPRAQGVRWWAAPARSCGSGGGCQAGAGGGPSPPASHHRAQALPSFTSCSLGSVSGPARFCDMLITFGPHKTQPF